jgi:2-oxopent-4-enoate/cis-2-oxohex-4-enoate hydratase
LKTKDSIKHKWFESLHAASVNTRQADSLVATFGDISKEQAYDIQAMLVEERLQNGEHIIGWKVGATSLATMSQLNITEPILGCMTSASYYPLIKSVKASDFCKLGVEGEIAFVMGKNLRGPGVTKADTITATAGIMGAIELVDCRTKDWKPSITEAIADNSLHAGIILGSSMKSIIGFDLSREGVILRKNGSLLASACGVEALGDPVNVVTWLANNLSGQGREIRKGEIILTGSLTQFYFVEPGDIIDFTFTSLGNIQFAVQK